LAALTVSTLSDRAGRAWWALSDAMIDRDAVLIYETHEAAFKHGWELGYRARRAEEAESISTLTQRIAGHLGIQLPEG
jgi:hypothetical protein